MFRWMFKQVDAGSLAVFRIGFGAIMLFESINYGLFLCLECMFHSSSMLFKYHHFEWVHALPTPGLRIIWLAMAIAAICIMLGYYYRIAMIAFTTGFTYMFLLEQILYLNHFYMVILFCFLMLFLPAHRYWSLDARRDPRIASVLIPNWALFVLLAQLEIIFIYAGVVKINPDWLNLEPMRLWMNYRSQRHGEFLQFLTQDWGIALASYGVIALHLIGAPLLLWRKTRMYALMCYAVFHTINAFVFNIGIFPWFTLFASLLFFDPHWPKQFWSYIRLHSKKLRQWRPEIPVRYEPEFVTRPAGSKDRMIMLLIFVWLTVQVVVPARNWWLPGNVAWNESGHRFSWRMMLRSKEGSAEFTVKDGSGQQWRISPASYLNQKQVGTMACIPDLIWQFAQYLAAEKRADGYRHVQVYATTNCSLNARERAPLVDTTVDLAAIPRSETVENWVLPLNEKLTNPILSF